MARLVGVDLPRDKRLEVALTYVYGIGRTRAIETLSATGISGDTRVHQITDAELVNLRARSPTARRPFPREPRSLERPDAQVRLAHPPVPARIFRPRS